MVTYFLIENSQGRELQFYDVYFPLMHKIPTHNVSKVMTATLLFTPATKSDV